MLQLLTRLYQLNNLDHFLRIIVIINNYTISSTVAAFNPSNLVVPVSSIQPNINNKILIVKKIIINHQLNYISKGSKNPITEASILNIIFLLLKIYVILIQKTIAQVGPI